MKTGIGPLKDNNTYYGLFITITLYAGRTDVCRFFGRTQFGMVMAVPVNCGGSYHISFGGYISD